MRAETKKQRKAGAMANIGFVEEVLRRWDPIGVIESPEENELPLDEYDSYAPPVFAMLQRGASESELAKHLDSIQTEAMGLGLTHDRNRQFASQLVAWWRERRNAEAS